MKANIAAAVAMTARIIECINPASSVMSLSLPHTSPIIHEFIALPTPAIRDIDANVSGVTFILDDIGA